MNRRDGYGMTSSTVPSTVRRPSPNEAPFDAAVRIALASRLRAATTTSATAPRPTVYATDWALAAIVGLGASG